MGRTIVDCRLEIADLTDRERTRVEKTCDKLGIPKDSKVQINLGVREPSGKE